MWHALRVTTNSVLRRRQHQTTQTQNWETPHRLHSCDWQLILRTLWRSSPLRNQSLAHLTMRQPIRRCCKQRRNMIAIYSRQALVPEINRLLALAWIEWQLLWSNRLMGIQRSTQVSRRGQANMLVSLMISRWTSQLMIHLWWLRNCRIAKVKFLLQVSISNHSKDQTICSNN